MAMVRLFLLFFPILGLTVAGQEGNQHINHHDTRVVLELHRPGYGAEAPARAVAVAAAELPGLSSSVLQAETWLRRYVLPIFPSDNVSAIVVGRGVLCSARKEGLWSSVLPSVKNLQHSLTRWGLEREIMVSAAFSSECLRRGGAVETLKPLLSHLWSSNSVYLVDPSSPSSSPGVTLSLVSAHGMSLADMKFSRTMEIWVVKEEKPLRRKLSTSSPNPNPPEGSFSFVPVSAPSEIPDSPAPAGFSGAAPPCGAAPEAALSAGWDKAWCVAKPTAPAELLQDAMDYACGEGGADCEEVKPQGSCFYPNNIIAHASFAFNSYWQKAKSAGGSCDFGGIAALINSDPSFLHCRYVLV